MFVHMFDFASVEFKCISDSDCHFIVTHLLILRYSFIEQVLT